MMVAYEAMRDLRLTSVRVETPLEITEAPTLEGPRPLLVPILRAGLGMTEGILKLIPDADVGHIGLYRNEDTLEPVDYYFKVPADAADRRVFLLDPMLATGGSAVHAIWHLEKAGVKHLKLLTLIAAPEGVAAVERAYPDIPVFTAALDRKLNDVGYILPGLGDAGDRIFGTL